MSARHYARLVPATPLPSARCDGSVPRLPGLASPRRGADRGARPGPARPLLVPAPRSRRSRFQLPGGGAAPAVLRGAENACSVQSAAPAVRSPRLTPRFGAPACAPRPCASSCPPRTPAAAVGRRPDAPRTARPPPRAHAAPSPRLPPESRLRFSRPSAPSGPREASPRVVATARPGPVGRALPWNRAAEASGARLAVIRPLTCRTPKRAGWRRAFRSRGEAAREGPDAAVAREEWGAGHVRLRSRNDRPSG